MMKRFVLFILCALACLCPTGAWGAARPAYLHIQGGRSRTVFLGQSFTLVAVAYDEYGALLSGELSVSWSSSNPDVARVDQQGRVVPLSAGRASITARASNGVADAVTVDVVKRASHVEINPRLWENLSSFNELLAHEDMALAFEDVSPGLVQTTAFQRAFRAIWNVPPSQVTSLNDVTTRFTTRNGYSSSVGEAVRSGIHISLTGRTRGDMLPMRYLWNYSWEELSKLLGRTVLEVPDVSELFRALTVEFHGMSGAGYPVVGSGGVTARDAEAAGALWVFPASGGVSIELTAYLANVQGPASSALYAPQLVEGLLIVPDGTADASIAGTTWMMEKPTRGGAVIDDDKTNKSGGGGCDTHAGTGAIFGGSALLLIILLLRHSKRWV